MNRDELIDALVGHALENGNFDSDISDFENLITQKYGRAVRDQFRKQLAVSKAGGLAMGKPFGRTDMNRNIDAGAVAGFTIVATRQTALIPQPLPAPIFGVIDRQSGYAMVLPNLPSGVTVKSISYGVDAGIANSSRLRIVYTSPAGDDAIDITCTQNPYPTLLEATRTDLLKMNGVRLSLSDSTKVAQFAQQFNVYKRTLAGKTEYDSLTPEMFKSPQDFQNGIVDIKKAITVDKETTIVYNIINEAGLQVSMNFYAGTYDKWNFQNDAVPNR